MDILYTAMTTDIQRVGFTCARHCRKLRAVADLIHRVPTTPSTVTLVRFDGHLAFRASYSSICNDRRTNRISFILISAHKPSTCRHKRIPKTVGVPKQLVATRALTTCPTTALFIICYTNPRYGNTGGTTIGLTTLNCPIGRVVNKIAK